jgi:type IV pilus biogenesis protein CpaD/CtpE
MYDTVPARWFLILTAALGIGCTPEPARWSELENPKENTLEFTTVSYTARFAPGAVNLSSGEVRALEQFASASILAGDHVSVELAAPMRGTPDGILSRRRAAIARLLEKLPRKPVVDAVQSGAIASSRDTAVLRVGHYIVTPPRCPDWVKPESDDYTNTPSSNFGCADVTNIGLMVADPADLVRGAPGGGADAVFAARGVTLYRSGAISKSLAAAGGPGAGGGGLGGDSGQGGGSSPGPGN